MKSQHKLQSTTHHIQRQQSKLEEMEKQDVVDLVPKDVLENRTKGVETKVDDTLKLVVFLECAQC